MGQDHPCGRFLQAQMFWQLPPSPSDPFPAPLELQLSPFSHLWQCLNSPFPGWPLCLEVPKLTGDRAELRSAGVTFPVP